MLLYNIFMIVNSNREHLVKIEGIIKLIIKYIMINNNTLEGNKRILGVPIEKYNEFKKLEDVGERKKLIEELSLEVSKANEALTKEDNLSDSSSSNSSDSI